MYKHLSIVCSQPHYIRRHRYIPILKVRKSKAFDINVNIVIVLFVFEQYIIVSAFPIFHNLQELSNFNLWLMYFIVLKSNIVKSLSNRFSVNFPPIVIAAWANESHDYDNIKKQQISAPLCLVSVDRSQFIEYLNSLTILRLTTR